ncbi:sensor domain-containing diguanylate cyclase [uncultured Vibrio sp.]|uniref:sensor domain-containing diguanylate cyclase n=1 Tax=uncultured Vibrio sp. TaxID=114054 RepID=UPI0025F0B3EF|nr:sensor domain-containing diguanylate cyclase [uncultured Vibrio sp.]
MIFKLHSRFVLFPLVFLTLSLVPTLFFINEWQRVEQRAVSLVEQETRNQLEFNHLSLQTIFSDIETTVSLLSSNRLLHSAVTEKSTLNLSAVEDLWIMIAQSKGYFSKLRFIDNHGKEIIRINSVDNFLEVVTSEFLQDKSQRDFFHYAQELKTNESGSFGIDVEYEYGKIVTPVTPAFRLITPVDVGNKRYGYFVANLNFSAIYDAMNLGIENRVKPDIITTQGYYLQSQTFSQLLGNIVSEHKRYNLKNMLPKVWTQSKTNNSGSVFDKGSWWSYSNISFASDLLGRDLLLVLNVPDQDMHQFIEEEYQDITLLAIAIYIIIILLSIIFCTWYLRHQTHSVESKIARAAMNGMSAVLISDRNNRIISVNQEFTRLSGYTLEDVKGKSPSIFASGKHQQQFYMKMWRHLLTEGIWEGEVVNQRKDGSKITEILRIQTVNDHKGDILFYVGSFVDITQRKELENRLRELSEKDALSGLWNRRKFDKQMLRETRRARRYPDQYHSCLAIIDIDDFKRINDQLGHDEGDCVIKAVAAELLEQIRETDFLARIGGEEFGLIMPHTQLDEAEQVLNRLREAVSLISEYSVTVSGGVSDIDDSVPLTYKRSDIALYHSKTSGKNLISVNTKSGSIESETMET